MNLHHPPNLSERVFLDFSCYSPSLMATKKTMTFLGPFVPQNKLSSGNSAHKKSLNRAVISEKIMASDN